MIKKTLFAALLVAPLVTSGCRNNDLDCLPEDLAQGEPREAAVTRTLLLEYRDGDWSPLEIIQSRRWKDRARHLSAGGTVELYDGTGTAPYASAPADGPAHFEASLLRSVPSDRADVTLQSARDRILEGAVIPLELPEGAGRATRVRWISSLGELESRDAQLRELLTEEGVIAPERREYNFDLTAVPEVELDGLARESRAYESHEGVYSPLPFEVLHWSGHPRSKVNLVLLPDGYTDDEMHLYREKADAIVADLLQNHDPYRTYAGLINVIRVDTTSLESGVDCDDGEYSPRENRYGSSFPVACLNALIGTSFNDRFTYQLNAGRVLRDSGAVYHEGKSITDEVYVISRSDKYGGTAIAWATQTDGTRLITAAHEMGHSWGRLADEYLVDGDLCHIYMMFSANVSIRKSKPKNVKWKTWMDPDLPFPTPNDSQYEGRVGFFQGAAGGCKKALYRPQYTCKMRSSRQAFCPVCMEQMIHRIFDRASLVEGGLEREGDTVTASVFAPERMFTRWYVDGEKVQETDRYEPLTGLEPGRHKVRLEVMDLQAPVRKNRCDLVTQVKARL